MWIPIVIDGSFCPVSLGMDYLGAVCPGGGVTGVFSPGYSLSIVRHTSALGDHPCRDSIAQAAVQMRSSVGRGFVSPIQGSMSRCHGMGGGGGGVTRTWPFTGRFCPILNLGWLNTFVLHEVLHGDPHILSSQRFVDGR